MCSVLSSIAFLILLPVSPFAKSYYDGRDSVVVSCYSYYYEFCMSSDSVLVEAKKRGVSIHYPTLVINGVVIRDTTAINIIRHCAKDDKLGPYHIHSRKRYSKSKAEKMGFDNISQDGIVLIKLKPGEVFDLYSLNPFVEDKP